MVENLIRAGLFRDGLQVELNQVSQRLNRAHSALSALEPESSDSPQASSMGEQVRQIRDNVRQAHRDLARISKVYTEADRLARRLSAVPTLTDDVALLKRDNLELRTYMAALLSMEAEQIEGGQGSLSFEERAVFAQHLRKLAIQIVPELQMELSQRAAEEDDKHSQGEAGDLGPR